MDRPILNDLVPIPRVWDRMAAVERRLLEVTRSDDVFLTDIAQHLLRAGGKRYRPLLAQVAAELGPNNGDGPVEAGVSVELVHVGSLYHDDVIDKADARRGQVSVNENWTNTIAILAGDFLLARASEIAAPLGEEAVALIAQTYARLCEGQVAELRFSGGLDHGTDGYYQVIGGKTASLIRTSARLGSLTAGAATDSVEAVSEWAWEMGLVFQMTDDVLDLIADEAFLGKPAGSDIGEGVYTLPVLYAADGPDGAEIRDLLADGAPADRADIRRIIDLTSTGGFVDRVIDEAMYHIRLAEAASDRIPGSGLTPVLRNLDSYLLDRVAVARAASA
ncbi:MAG TPA: polyprenyl synthetase family protein [Acidimicrobiia bacterium]|nr:polyprenyl synthetase family protein [Acidimicrobiia bacterium]